METDQPSPLGSLLLRNRKLAELTQESLAERAGVSVNTISNLEAGRGHLPRSATLELLVTALADARALTPSERADLWDAFKAGAAATRLRLPSAADAPPVVPRTPTLPSGSVTFLICAIVTASTGLLKRRLPLPSDFIDLAAQLQSIAPPLGGHVVAAPDEPDGAICVFRRAGDALTAACTLQQVLRGAEAPGPGAVADGAIAGIPVALVLHSGSADPGSGDFSGPTLRRAVRLARVGHAGQVLLSFSSRELVGDSLPEGLRLQRVGDASLCAVERPQPVYQVQRATRQETFPPLRTLPLPPTNLPLQVTSFIGREQQQADVGDLLTQAPVVSLVGSGGCGKTRLALQVAANRLEDYADGVWLVELAPLAESTPSGASPVPQAVAAVLGLREEAHRPIQATLIEWLRAKQMLLVLDNCEHLIAACADFAAAALRVCPSLQLLVTSRERLAIRGEVTYHVPSLTVAEPSRHLWPIELEAYEAVRLFVERAHAVQATFALTAENVDAVIGICARLDGIPLAIELAAARVSHLAIEEIVMRLDQSIGLLVSGPRDVLPRHRTLRATLDWSWELLNARERALLVQLAVFAGGWTLTAAEAVCVVNGADSALVPDSLWALLDGLTNKSLVILDTTTSEARYKLLETVRQYAAERLAEDGQAAWALRDRHLQWCLALVEEAEPRLSGPEQGTWLVRLECEHDNLRAALGWAREQEASEQGLRLAGGLWRFWQMRGYLGEGRCWLETELARVRIDASGAAVRARALNGAGNLADSQGDYGRAVILYEEALHLHRSVHDTRGTALSLNGLGNVAQKQGDYARAVTMHEEALALRRALGDTWSVGASLSNLAIARNLQGQHDQAAALLEEALALKRALGDTWGIASTLNNLGQVVAEMNDHERAALLHEEALQLRRALGDTLGIATSLRNLGFVAAASGDRERAKHHYEEALALQRTLGDKLGIADSLYQLGVLAYRRQDYRRAAALMEEGLLVAQAIGVKDVLADSLEGFFWVSAALEQWERAAWLSVAVEKLRAELGTQVNQEEQAAHAAALRSTREALGNEALAAAQAAGNALSLEHTITRAFEAVRAHIA